MKKIFVFTFDLYISNPIIIDIIISIIIWILSVSFPLFEFQLEDRAHQVASLSHLIRTDVVLAGFILASLSIILSFRSNLKLKNVNDSKNAQELLFSSIHYNRIVVAFQKSLIELVLCFVFLFIISFSSDNFTIETINRFNVIGLFITSTTICRSLFILFKILELSKYKKSN